MVNEYVEVDEADEKLARLDFSEICGRFHVNCNFAEASGVQTRYAVIQARRYHIGSSG